MNDSTDNNSTPWWFTAICILMALPATALPELLNLCNPDLKAFVWLYPVYVVASCFLAWKVYPARQLLAWILLAITLLSHGAIWIMVTQPNVIIY